MSDITTLHANVQARFQDSVESAQIAANEITLILKREQLLDVATALRDEEQFAFNLLIDVCGVDYLHYGVAEWATTSTTSTGFDRGVDRSAVQAADRLDNQPRFGVVYHLLSTVHNHRIRLKVFLSEDNLVIPSVFSIWPAANWFEREAFDLFGILFESHPDLRRLLTDYGFIGHPFRKDFPLIGNTEVRYDAKLKRVVYEPVSITPRILEPKVIRRDNRYEVGDQ